MGYYLSLDAIDKKIDLSVLEESTKDIPNMKRLLTFLRLGTASTINNGGFAIKKSWVGLLQPYFNHVIDIERYNYSICFNYSVVENKPTTYLTSLDDDEVTYWRKNKINSVKHKFLNADKIRRKFKGSELVMIIEREHNNNRMISNEWETVDFKNDLTILDLLDIKLDRFASYPNVTLTRKHKKILSRHLTKKLVSCRHYTYVAYFYFSRKTKYKFI